MTVEPIIGRGCCLRNLCRYSVIRPIARVLCIRPDDVAATVDVDFADAVDVVEDGASVVDSTGVPDVAGAAVVVSFAAFEPRTPASTAPRITMSVTKASII